MSEDVNDQQLSPEELEGQSAEMLPAREVMSLLGGTASTGSIVADVSDVPPPGEAPAPGELPSNGEAPAPGEID